MADTITDIMPPTGHAKEAKGGFRAAAAVAALGIVYGDIGTSPLYAFKQAADSVGPLSQAAILGVLSLVFWALIMIVSVKYAILILRAENHGEGGIVALLALLDARAAKAGTARAYLLVVGLIGAALLYGDGVITPAISVLSAIEGLKLDAPQLAPLVVPVTVAILLGLFIVQRKGTGFIGAIFGPVMLVWFAAIGLMGLAGIWREPAVLAALSPIPALHFLLSTNPLIGFAVLGAAFLAVTGGEAMYADMGHFGAGPIRLGWFATVLPCLVLNYFGQGALLLADKANLTNPFFLLAPSWAHYPLVLFATAATIIASQAIISGAFSLTQQAIQLGFLPNMNVFHTASLARGQIYMPMVNWLLAVGSIGAVFAFRTSDALGGAYGIAVSLLMAITTVLAGLVAIKWGYRLSIVIAVNGFFLLIDLVFVAANATKLFDGGWFPLGLAMSIAFLMMTWRRGANLVEEARAKMRQPEDDFLAALLAAPPLRLPGTAAIFTAATSGVPLALTHQMKHTRVLHERVLLISGVVTQKPFQDRADHFKVIDMGHGIFRLVVQFGFMELPNMEEALRDACIEQRFPDIDFSKLTYYFRRETVLPGNKLDGMASWRKRLFSAMHLNSHRNAAYYGVPAAQVVEIGLEVEI